MLIVINRKSAWTLETQILTRKEDTVLTLLAALLQMRLSADSELLAFASPIRAFAPIISISSQMKERVHRECL